MPLDDYVSGNSTEGWEYLTMLKGPGANTYRKRGTTFTLPQHGAQRSGNNSGATRLGQSVFRGYKRQVKASNGKATAQPTRPLGSTQTVPSGNNRVNYLCPEGLVTGTETRGIAHIPAVDSRGDGLRLSWEKGSTNNDRQEEDNQLTDEECRGIVSERKWARFTRVWKQPGGIGIAGEAECRAISPRQPRRNKTVTYES